MHPLLYFGRVPVSDHEGCNQCKDCVEFRKGGVDERVGEHVMSLGKPYYTVGADLALSDGRYKADKTYTESHSEEYGAVSGEVLAKPHQEGYETVEALCGRQRGKYHIACGLVRVLFQGSFRSVPRDSRADAAADSRKSQHEAETEITEN